MQRLALFSMLVLASHLAVAGTVYRWVDGNGQVHFGQVPPPSGKYDALQPHGVALTPSGDAQSADDTETITSAPPPGATIDETAKFLQEADEANKARAEARAKAKQEKAEAEQKCTAARQRVAYLEERTPRRLATTNPDGSVTRMNEEEFAKRQQAAQKEVDDNCR